MSNRLCNVSIKSLRMSNSRVICWKAILVIAKLTL